MQQKDLERIRDKLLAVGISAFQTREVISGLESDTPRSRPFAAKKQPLFDALRALRNGKVRWRESRKTVYAAYEQLLERTIAELNHDERTYATPEEAKRAAEEVNKQRAADGKRPLAEKDGHWSRWIPPHIRAATVIAFDRMYADEVEAGVPPGRRVIPFSTVAQRGALRNKWNTLLAQITPHLLATDKLHPALVDSHTRDITPTEQREFVAKALVAVHRERYRAAFTARKIIKGRMIAVTSDLTPPLHWTHVLEEPERARLRQAEVDAGGDGWTRGTFGRLPNAEQDLLRAASRPVQKFEPLPLIRGDRPPTAADTNGQAWLDTQETESE